MKKTFRTLTLVAAILAGSAHAQDTLPDSCRPKVGDTELSLADQTAAAQLQCDIDRAAILVDRSARIHNVSNAPLIRIVDTKAPSGAAYIYEVVSEGGVMMLDARTVPSNMEDERPVPLCQLHTELPADVSSVVAEMRQTSASPEIPDYGPRERMVVNADGSRSFELLLDPHDVITSIETINGSRQFSRHADATDPIADLNTRIIGVANFSDQWVCNLNTN